MLIKSSINNNTNKISYCEYYKFTDLQLNILLHWLTMKHNRTIYTRIILL